jgi:predicted amidohydrolase YtcJ
VILHNGVIRTLQPLRPTVRELTIEGSIVRSRTRRRGKDEQIDLGGRCVVPGFTDSHTHFVTWAIRRSWLDMTGRRGSGLLEVLRAAVARAARDRWLVGHGWSSAPEDAGGAPTREAIDRVSGAVPVALWSKDMHTFLLNSAGLARAANVLSEGNGVIERDAAGEPTGILREAAAWRFRERHLSPNEDDDSTVIRGVAEAHARGLTAIHDKDGWVGALELWRRVRDRGALTLRVWQALPPHRAFALDELQRAEINDAFLRVGYIKVFVDGSLGSGTALFLDGNGVTTTTSDELREIIRTASEAGWPVGVHAIGDRANRLALDAFEATRHLWQPRGLRQRVEHAQHLHADDVPRFAGLGVACSVQFTDAIQSRDAVDGLPSTVADGSFVFRSLWNSGALLVNGSDAPLTELDPLRGIRAAVLRTLDERPAWRPHQALTAMQALEASTINPAWLSGEEQRRGRLVDGQLADLVVLDRDPIECSRKEMHDIRVVATMVGGRWVHNPPPWD